MNGTAEKRPSDYVGWAAESCHIDANENGRTAEVIMGINEVLGILGVVRTLCF